MNNFYVGQKVIVCYNAYPLYPYTEYEGIIKKITPRGYLRIQDSVGRNELYDPNTQYAKGWKTLYFKTKD